MFKKIYKTFVIVFLCFLFLPVFKIGAQAINSPVIIGDNQLKITSIHEGEFLGGSISVKGESLPNMTIVLTAKDEKDTFSYSIKTNSDAQGNWSTSFSQLLKSGEYYVEAAEQNPDGSLGEPVRSNLIYIKGPFALIIGILSFLVVILLFGFVIGWYASKLAGIRRYRRLLMSQRDIITYYNMLNGDVTTAIKNLSGIDIDNGKISETSFLLKQIGENLTKMKKYISEGIKMISKYDTINNLENRKL